MRAALTKCTGYTSHRVFHSRSTSRTNRVRYGFYLPLAAVPFVGWFAFQDNEATLHSLIAVQRCFRIGQATVLSMVDYKRTATSEYASVELESEAWSKCHTRSAQRVLRALLDNSGIYIKLGQHVSSLVLVPPEWSSTLRPLQDQCNPTPYADVEQLFQSEVGYSIPEIFDTFDPTPIGVASLAQVHKAVRHGEEVAVKIQHPNLDEFTKVDMRTVEILINWVTSWFPEFEFTWLAEEMRENLPKELNFVIEAENANRTSHNFASIKTSLYIPHVIFASKRVLIMEFIQGGRIDDKLYMTQHEIDKNKVSVELQHIFSRMVHIDGWFHADPHPGNVLIRRSGTNSASPYNFEIVLLDHGLYFDLDEDLRLNYSKLWLSLLEPNSPVAVAKRKKYAQLVGDIGPELFSVFETAITGQISLPEKLSGNKPLIVTNASANHMGDNSSLSDNDAIVAALMNQNGLLQSIFDLLRKLPRRLLMVLKLNDLTRNLDKSLETTHSQYRLFVILARYCALAVWIEEKQKIWAKIGSRGATNPSWMVRWGTAYWNYQRVWYGLRIVEEWMDLSAMLSTLRQRLRFVCVNGL